MARGGKRVGAGRKAGARNKITVALRATLSEMARDHTVLALQTLIDVMVDAKTPKSARASCASIILDRGHGRAPQHLELTGKDGKPIETKDLTERPSDIEIARRLAFLLSVAASKPEGGQ